MISVIEFQLFNVPESWSNQKAWSRGATLAQHKKMTEWTDLVVFWGRVKRVGAGWELASEGHSQRHISIHQIRHGLLDDDNLFSSVKPLLDGCKTFLRRKKQTVYGSGLIWNDNPRYCHLGVTQEKVTYRIPCRVIIRVERFDL